MKWALAVLLAFAALVAVAALVGSRIPRDHVATVRARYAAKPEAIWAVVSNPSAAMTWRTDVKSVETLPPVDGKIAWREESGSGRVSFVMSEWDPPRRMVSRITSEDIPFGGQWEFSLTPAGAGTELSITERGFVKPALFRVMAHTIFGYTSTMEGYHRALATKLGESVTPEVVASGR